MNSSSSASMIETKSTPPRLERWGCFGRDREPARARVAALFDSGFVPVRQHARGSPLAKCAGETGNNSTRPEFTVAGGNAACCESEYSAMVVLRSDSGQNASCRAGRARAAEIGLDAEGVARRQGCPIAGFDFETQAPGLLGVVEDVVMSRLPEAAACLP